MERTAFADAQLTREVREQYILHLANELLKKHRLADKDWTIKIANEAYDMDCGAAGFTWFRGRVILLTREYLIDTDIRNVGETIRHEIAHALTSGEHDQRWLNELIRIGGTGVWYGSTGATKTFPSKD